MNDSTTSFDVYFTINNDPSNAIYRETYEHKNRLPAFETYCEDNPDRTIIGFYRSDMNATDRLDLFRPNFERLCSHYGFEPSDFGKRFRGTSTTYKLVGFRPNNRKYVILLLDEMTGKTIKASISFIQLALQGKTPNFAIIK